MTMTSKLTVLDAELNLLGSSPARKLGHMETAALKTLSVGLDRAPEETDAVTVKLLTVPDKMPEAETWVTDAGGKVISSGPQVMLADLPVAALRHLDECGYMQQAEAARNLLPRLDMALGPVTGTANAATQHGLDGSDVVLGVIDTGVDWRHDDFREPGGDSRFEFFGYANRPIGSLSSVFEEFDRETIDQALAGNANVPDGDPHGHGTHCASIAAGNGRAFNNQFRGVASNATLMAVRSEPLLDTHTIWGIRKIFDLAGDRPAVVSLSLGGHVGPHDGTTNLENVITRESGPGRIVVVAAGNEGADGIHWQGDLENANDLLIPVRVRDPDLQIVDVWIPRGDEVEISVESPDGVLTEPDGAVHNSLFGAFVADWRTNALNLDQNLTLRIGGGLVNHRWHIRIRPLNIVHGRVHAWAATQSPSNTASLFDGAIDPAYSIGMPATADRAISVGSFVSRNQFDTTQGTLVAQGLSVGQLSPFSSHGPARQGALKPDIAAPGQYVTAALADNSEMNNSAKYQPRHHPSGSYITIQGTSMATPFVAGVIALMLQREPRLTPEEVRQRLRVTAARDDRTGRVWDTGFGFGKIDVGALLDHLH